MARPEAAPQEKKTPATPEETECDTHLSLLKIKLMKMTPRLRDEIMERIQGIAAEALRQQENPSMPSQTQYSHYGGGAANYYQRPQSQSTYYVNSSQMPSTIYTLQESSQSQLQQPMQSQLQQPTQSQLQQPTQSQFQQSTLTTVDDDSFVRLIRSIPGTTIAAVTTASAATGTSSTTLQASNLDKPN